MLRRVNILDSVCDEVTDLEYLVDKVKDNPLSSKQIHLIQKRCICLRACNDSPRTETKSTIEEFASENLPTLSHIDANPTLFQFVEMKYIGGNLSVRKSKESRHIIFIGQDESVFQQNSFAANLRRGPNGESTLLPKSRGYNKMVPAYVARPFGSGLHLSP